MAERGPRNSKGEGKGINDCHGSERQESQTSTHHNTEDKE